MKFLPCLLCALIAISLASNAQQWSNSGSNVYTTNTGDVVGIGLSSPAYKLDVNGTVRSRNDLRTTVVGTGNGYFADDGAGSTIFSFTRQTSNEVRFQGYGFLTFRTNGSSGTERMRITNTGEVGIGTTTPELTQHVLGGFGWPATSGTTQTGILRLQGTGSNVVLDFSAYGTNGASLQVTNRTDLSNEYPLILNPNGGNVGLGETTPSYALSIKRDENATLQLNTVNSGTSSEAALRFRIDTGGKDGYIQYKSDGRMAFNLDNSGAGVDTNEYMTILQNGNVGIGTSSPTVGLHVNGNLGVGDITTSSSPGMSVTYTDGGSGTTVFKQQKWGGDIYFKRESSGGERNQFYFGGSNGHRMDIYDGSNVVNVSINSSGVSYFNGGNVGIGTVNPDHKFQIGDASAVVNLSLRGPDGLSGSSSLIFEDTGTTGSKWFKISNNTLDNSLCLNSPEQTNLMTFARTTGNVGIGVAPSASTYKLAVNGKVWTTEVLVQLSNPGPDYVFDKEYKLSSLEEIKSYIELNKHLPEVPSAKEMEEKGINLGEMNMLLLKKVEELTLYQIAADKQLNELMAAVDQLKLEIRAQDKQKK